MLDSCLLETTELTDATPHLKNKLLKGLTQQDVLVWEEEKMRFQRRMGRKVTDLDFLRFLLMQASRPVISTKEGVTSAAIMGQAPVYEKTDGLLDRYRSRVDSVLDASGRSH